MTATDHTSTPTHQTVPVDGPRLVADDLVLARGGRRVLDGVSLSLAPGELVAIVGESGAGKSTLLASLAGLTRPMSGSVTLIDPTDGSSRSPYGAVGLVPQDDSLHADLPLGRTLLYAAGLRLSADRDELRTAVHNVLREVRLLDRATVPVRALSGGQRKRASIAVELLARPTLFLLDEPTSGLDPATARSLVATLRELADGGAGIAFTTHALADVQSCDRLVVMAPGGLLVHDGSPDDRATGVRAAAPPDGGDRPADASVADTLGPSGRLPAASFPVLAPRAANDSPAARRPPQRPSGSRQLVVLTQRAAEIMLRNRLTLAILLGSPAAVIAMFAVLFRPGVLDAGASPLGAVMEAYWLAFAGFFFGLTYGLLQVVSEVPILRREHQSGVRDAAYLASKVALLLPLLMVVNAAMLVVLRSLDRLPALDPRAWVSLSVTLDINALVALFLGLLASAMVTSVAQASLALPMLCFPAVLFSGAMVPVPVMTGAGALMAGAMPDRWAFEAIARHLGIHRLVATGSPYADLGQASYGFYWTVLAATATLLVAGAYLVLRRRAR